MWNNGIVLGDKANHVATIHFPQVFYCVTFIFALTAILTLHPQTFVRFGIVFFSQVTSYGPLFLPLCFFFFFLCFIFSFFFSKVSQIPPPCGRGRWIYPPCASLHVWLALIAFLTSNDCLPSNLEISTRIEHPFLLADNRHYPFYLWKNIFRRFPVVRYAAIPFYWFFGWELLLNLSQTQSVIWILGYCVTVILTLVPTPLVEFRYYILPFIFYRLHIPQPKMPRLAAEITLFAAINVITLWLFLQKPFVWPSAPQEVQRFMW